MVWNITRDYLSATRKMRRRRTDFPRFRGNVNDVDVIFGSRLRHSALMEFRAVSTWYDHNCNLKVDEKTHEDPYHVPIIS